MDRHFHPAGLSGARSPTQTRSFHLFAFCLFLSPLLKRILTFGGIVLNSFQGGDLSLDRTSVKIGISGKTVSLRRRESARLSPRSDGCWKRRHSVCRNQERVLCTGVRKPGGEGGSGGLREPQRRDDSSFSTCGGSAAPRRQPPPPGSPPRGSPGPGARTYRDGLQPLPQQRRLVHPRSPSPADAAGSPRPP